MANRKKRPSYGTAKQKDVEALMGALLTQVRAETTDAINLALRRHDERYHAEYVDQVADEDGFTGTPVLPSARAALAVPDYRLVGLNGEPL